MFSKFSKKTTASPIDFIVAGLGNPGDKYQLTRHNAGFMALEMLEKQLGFRLDRIKFKSACADVKVGDKRVLFMRPSTYMNLSGEAVREAMEFYKIPLNRVLIIYDDCSLPVGRIRVRRKGSHGGHNGIKSIIYLTGLDEFPRIKIGVGEKPHPDYDMADWVLGRFSKDDLKTLEGVMEQIPDIVKLIINDKTDEAMNKFN